MSFFLHDCVIRNNVIVVFINIYLTIFLLKNSFKNRVFASCVDNICNSFTNFNYYLI